MTEPKDGRRDLRISSETLHPIPEIGVALWQLQDARSRTLALFDDPDAIQVDWHPAEERISVGSVLYHLAAIEMDWLYEEVLVQPFPDTIWKHFLHPIRDGDSHLSFVVGESLIDHLQRLRFIRSLVL